MCSRKRLGLSAVAAHGSSFSSSSPVARRPQGRLPFARMASTLVQGSHLGLYGRRTTRAHTTCRAAVRGVAGRRPSRDLTLGCVGHHCASARPTLTAHSVQPSGFQRRDARRRGDASLHPATNARHDDRLTEASLGDGEHKDMGCPGATNSRGRLHTWLD
jgi:hypothetical protein